MIQELDYKQRKIRSLRGFFFYALEILENGKDYEILQTNLQPFFWRKVKNTIQQNKKAALQEFLFGSQESSPSTEIQNDLKDKITSLQNQLNSLQQRIIQLENNQNNQTLLKEQIQKALSGLSQPLASQTALPLRLESPKTIHHSNHSAEMKEELLEHSQAAKIDQTSPHTPHGFDYKNPSEVSRSLKTDTLHLEQGNLPSNLQNDPQEQIFTKLNNLTQQEKTEIIETGFQHQAEGKISLKKYYQSTDLYSLFQSKGYTIKYETIRRTKIYQQLKFQL